MGEIASTYVDYDDGTRATYTYAEANVDESAGVYRADTAKVLRTCDDPRYAGPMKFIEYEYVASNEPNVDPTLLRRGQIKAEKNKNHQVVSRTSFPTSYSDPNLMRRTETRGDGPSRILDYAVFGDGFWSTVWKDYKNQPFTTSYYNNFYGWTTTDARNNTTTYERENEIGAIRKISFPATADNGVTTREYAFSGLNVPYNPYFHYGEKDENGDWTYFDRDPVTHQVMQIRYPDQSTEQFTYNNLGQVLTHKLRSGGTETFEYDNQPPPATRGLKTSYTPPATESDPNPGSHRTFYTYYGPEVAAQHPGWIDRLKSVTDPLNHVTRYEYNNRGQVTKVIHHDNTYTQSMYNEDGTLAWTADENHPNAWMDGHENERTRYTYDEYKRVVTVTNPMDETTTNYYALDWANPLLHTTNTVKYTLSPLNKTLSTITTRTSAKSPRP